MGDIGQTTARLCKALGMKIIAPRNSRGAAGNELADEVYVTGEGAAKQSVFEKADFVICSLPGGASTNKFCGRTEFNAMKSTAVFISLGRGTCVDEGELVQALKGNQIAGAALDVFAVEPL